jgi:hypothetical protein
MKKVGFLLGLLLLATFSPGCSVYLEATRPEPMKLSEFQLGMSRDMVFGKIGAPESSAPGTDGDTCDYYQLYTRGYGAAGKVPIALAEGAADFFTAGLAEFALTPAEGITRNKKHPITFCYNKDQMLARIGAGVDASLPIDQNGDLAGDASVASNTASTPPPSAQAKNPNLAVSAAPPVQAAPATQPEARAEPVATSSTSASAPVSSDNQLEIPAVPAPAAPSRQPQGQSQQMPTGGQ